MMTAKKIKIGVVIGSPVIGGAEMDIIRNFPKLDRSRFEVVVINFNPGLMDAELEREGIRVLAKPPRVGDIRLLVLRVGAWIRWIGKMLKREQVDIAHFFLPHSYLFGMMACLIHPTAKRVMSRLGRNTYQESRPVYRFAERRLLHRFLDRAVGNCRAILGDLKQEGIPRDRLLLLYNGIDPRPLLRQPDSRTRARRNLDMEENVFLMAAVGNLYPIKGHRELIEACALIKDELPGGWQLWIAGRDVDDNQSRYQTLIRECSLESHIRFLGMVPDVTDLLWAANLFVHPSHREGFPNAVLEAMCASLPVVANRVGGIPEQIIDSPEDVSTGWLVPAQDPKTLSKVLLEAALDPQRCESMGQRGLQRVRNQFSIEKSVGLYESLYEELAERG